MAESGKPSPAVRLLLANLGCLLVVAAAALVFFALWGFFAG
jgi:hypothetical protein